MSRTFFILTISNILIILVYYLSTTSKLPICWSIMSPPSYVITLSGHDQRVSTVPYYGINGNILYKSDDEHHLTRGERGLRDTMKNFFTMVLHKNYNEVFVFDDDAIPHLNFTTLLNKLPNRCHQADVLLLGATICHESPDRWPTGTCFDADERTYGSFALLVKKTAFVPILNWLKIGEKSPFDTVYAHLQKHGINVRVAYPPFLAIPDVSHPSLVNKYRIIDEKTVEERAAKHDWHLENYPMSVIPV
jgi:hypothetical protein